MSSLFPEKTYFVRYEEPDIFNMLINLRASVLLGASRSNFSKTF